MGIDELIARCLSGNGTEKQNERLKHWIDKSEENRRHYSYLEKAWKYRPSEKIFMNEDEISDRVWIKLNDKKKISLRGLWTNKLLRIAAVFALVILSGIVLINQMEEEKKPIVDAKAEKLFKSNPRGVKSKIRLPDGSTVVLNSESTIKYGFNESDSIRLVELTGEAFFTVKKNVEKPFIVKANNIQTEVFGTQFNFSAYPEDPVVNVSLLEGSVRVSVLEEEGDKHQVFLEPGEGMLFDKIEEKFDVKPIDPMNETCWKDGFILFDNSNLNDVISVLSRWYDVDIKVENYTNKSFRHTGKYKDEYLEVILESMSYSEHFEYEINSNQVIIKFN